MRDSSAAASGWSGTGWATSSWSGTGWRTSSGWSGTGWGTAGRANWLAAALLAALVANLAALDLGQAELRHLEAVRLLAAAIAARVASGGTGRGRSGTGWRTSDRSCTARGTSSGSSTARSWSGTRSGSTATAVALVVEQAGIGTVDAGKTNQRGGHPYKFHLSLSYSSGPWNVRDCRALIRTPCQAASAYPWTQGLRHCLSFRTGRTIPVSQTISI